MSVNNSQYQKNSNTSLVAGAIWKNPGISRAEISEEFGLYRSTVTNITSYLIGNGILEEGALLASNEKGGRKATSLALVNEFGAVLGIDIQPSGYRYMVLGMKGEALLEGAEHTGRISFLELLDASTETGVVEVRKLGIPLLAISYSIPGTVDTPHGALLFSTPLSQKEKVDVKGRIESRYGVPVLLDNDANCISMVDLFENRLSSSSNALILKSEVHEDTRDEQDPMAIGLGMGILIGGRIYRGTHYSAGEFISLSWNRRNESQSGLDEETLLMAMSDEKAWKRWMDDTFRTIVPLLSILDIEKLILHGTSFSDEKKMHDYLLDPNSDFSYVLGKTGTTYEIGDSDKYLCARGAALRFLTALYTVREVDDHTEGVEIDWDTLIERATGKRSN
ncbi:MAG: ROK family protein [Spirochaetales bacterium]|nr:ROK family protein [Candidatus Physcosoma equi]